MSKIMTVLTSTAKVKRTIDHSPTFPDPATEGRNGRPARRIPVGGFLTG